MVRRIGRGMIILSMILAIATGSGCWNNRDVTQMNFAAAVGLDKTPDHRIELTVQIVKPSALRAGQNGSEGGGQKEKAVWVFSTTGDTVFEAGLNIFTTSNRRIFLGHIQVMVIGEDLAREGMMKVLDFFERDHGTNKKADVIIARHATAKEILQADSKLEDIPAMHIVKILKNVTAVAKMERISLITLLKEIGSPGKDPAVGVIEVTKKEEPLFIDDMTVEGAAVLKKDKLVGWLNPQETRGLLFAENKVQNDIIKIPNPGEKDKKVSIQVFGSRAKKEVRFVNGKPLLLIEIQEEGNITEQQGKGDLTTMEMIGAMEKETARVIEKEIRDTVEAAQKKYRCDIFGFGEVVHREYLDYWNQVKANWDEEFSGLPVEIRVESSIRRSGMIKKPTTPE